ncbi:MAG: arsenite methyltransferase [Phycisphaerae bacterium]|nr:arsenite methyltransferase [Phycisphaerae bacterium]
MTEPNDCNQDQTIYDAVREGYGQIARQGALSAGTAPPDASGCCGPSSCCGSNWSPDQLAERIGYSADQLAVLPEGANMGLSCGNPTAIAALRPGQIVLDLGSGGGFDCFLAGPKVGATGRVIGVDMTPDMLSKARGSIRSYRERTGLDNVEFRLGEIEHLPVADAGVDVVISNCVINLSPDKPQVWREIARVLRPGGTVAISDIALLRPLPQPVREMVAALVGCVAGAVLLDEYRAMIATAGFVSISVQPKPEYVETLSRFEDPLYRRIAEALPAGTTASDFITSVDATASKRA